MPKLNKKILAWVFFISLFTVLPVFNSEVKIAFLYGCFIAGTNKLLDFLYFKKQEKKVSSSAYYSLFLLGTSFVTRLFFIVFLFFVGLKSVGLLAKPLLMGFVLGQIILIIDKLIMVNKK